MKLIFKHFLALFILFQVSSCAPVINKKTVNHIYSNVEFSPSHVEKLTSSGLSISISPIGAEKLNLETFNAASRDGNYENEFVQALEHEENENDRITREERETKRGKSNCFSAVAELVKLGEIPENIGYYLKKRIAFGSVAGKDGSEITNLSNSENFDDEFNPFKVNGKYLSVFKITSENKSSEIIKLKIDDFQILSGEEQLQPLKMAFFEENLKNHPEKIKNAYRMNMPEELTITPNQKITKYIAIPAINSLNRELKAQYIKDNKFVNFDFAVSGQSLPKSYEFEQYKIMSSYGESSTIKYYYAVSYDDGASFAIADDKLFVNSTTESNSVDIYGIGFGLSSGKVFFCKTLNLNVSELKKKTISLKFSEYKK